MHEEVLSRLIKAYYEVRRGKRKHRETSEFESCLVANLILLADEIIHKTYHPNPGIAFPVEKPVPREIFAGPFRDRVVHHFLCGLTMEKFDKTFIDASFSCRVGKGTLYGQNTLYRDMQRITNNWTEKAWVFKFDLQGFFMSLQREKLLKVVMTELEKFEWEEKWHKGISEFLWDRIIMDEPLIGVRRKGLKQAWEKIPKTKSLFHQPKGRGIVIGNLTSQLLSNIYLNQLDHFITDELGLRDAYGRYVDDFYLLVKEEDREWMKNNIRLIEDYARGLGLVLHPKKRYIQPLEKGVDFLGGKIYKGRKIVGKRIRGNFYNVYIRHRENRADIIGSYIATMQEYRSWDFIWKMIGKIDKNKP